MEKLNCILLVDDDPVNNYLNEKLFNSLDVSNKVKVAMDGEEALLYLTKHGSPYDFNYPDLIILDYNMPQMQGNEFLELFNQINSTRQHKCHIVILTSSISPEVKKQMLELGVDEYIEKPLTKSKIHHLLERVVS